MTEKICKNCYYFRKDNESGTCFCYYNPPQVLEPLIKRHNVRPVILEDDFCSKFKEK